MSKESMNSFAGKWALITGASSCLGLEFADLLAAQKVNLVLAARRQESMEKLASDLRQKYGVDVLVEAIDLASPGAASRLKCSLDAKSLTIDILLNNAGYGLHGDLLETPIECTVNLIQFNITTLTELTYLFGLDMAKRRSGHILLVASLMAFQAVPSYAAYAATKAYVLALGEAIHNELRPHGVIATTLCPGHTETGSDAAAGATTSALLRLLTMKSRPVAASGIQALLQGKAMVVAGLANKIVAFSNRLAPQSMQRARLKRIVDA
ncbi:MAG: SDR family NAD(P)-dependent oxidoreductase [Pandoraea sp.]|nr:MAG: SDR family NAD(P)-dependent oxidoreductase [Pandoraea sp.]TAM18221.1 MAG: SDR family NAD(P)-dependent oxidoreductase [Pandoraea sp.]